MNDQVKEKFRAALLELPLEESTRRSIETMFMEVLLTGSIPSEPGIQQAGDSLTDTAPVFDTEDEWLQRSEGSLGDLKLPDRYWDMGLIGSGAMGEVHRVYDRTLRRVVAMKVIRDDLKNPVQAASRFVEEAQISAQLAHPGIVPVHDIGRLPDGRWYFTAQEARGRTLTAVIKEVHATRVMAGAFDITATGWTFRRLIDAFYKLCEGVAYAHARHVVHRDIKPDNVLVGDFGEVIVLDWGLARAVGVPEDIVEKSPFLPVESDRRMDGLLNTREGAVAGTPAFMSPEQARGEHHLLSPASDVYALGGVLYTMLFGHHPYEGLNAREALDRVRKGPPPFPEATTAPQDLVAISRKAMSLDPVHRYPDAGALAAAIGAWQEGANARERARSRVEAVRNLVQRLKVEHGAVVRRRERARGAVARLRASDPIELKEKVWAEEEAAIQALVEMEDAYQDVAQELRAALSECPDLPEARGALADLYRDRYDTAVSFGDEIQARSFERLVQEYDIGHHAAFLARSGVIHLHTQPAAAMVEVHRFANRARRLARDLVTTLGPTPLEDVSLPTGSYLLVLRAPGSRVVNFPVELSRDRSWDLLAPGEEAPRIVRLPSEKRVPRGMVFVPAGWAIFGGDSEAAGALPRQRLWCEDFFIGRYPVTHAEYLAFLNGLLEEGRVEEAYRHQPGRPGTGNEPYQPLYARSSAGTFVLPPHSTAGPLHPQAPVNFVSWHDAVALCLWLQRRTGLPWRLPGEAEREKAARGVDGRPFPWGATSDPAFHCFRDVVLEYPNPPEVSRFPVDTSPYEVCGLAGGVADWCAETFRQRGLTLQGAVLTAPEPPAPGDASPGARGDRKAVRGGSFDGASRAARAASRAGMLSTVRSAGVGFRLALSGRVLLG